jgi:glycolate oxidase iron-sulfur subunit
MGARGRVILGKELLKATGSGKDMTSFFDSFYSCLDCFACLQVCPAGVNAGKVSQLSRSILVESGERGSKDPVAEMIIKVTEKTMNPLGQGKQMARWSNGLKFDRNSEYLLYTGNM